MPTSVDIDSTHLMYPKAWGLPALREAISGYYNHAYGCDLDPENVIVFAGGRPAIIASLLFLDPDITVRIASTEYTPYYDMLERLGKRYELVDSNVENGFAPSVADYMAGEGRSMVVLSNPCNPTGITRSEEDLAALVAAAESGDTGVLVDEAYEFFHDPPVSARVRPAGDRGRDQRASVARHSNRLAHRFERARRDPEQLLLVRNGWSLTPLTAVCTRVVGEGPCRHGTSGGACLLQGAARSLR